jgi:hypothetical protein
MLQSRRSKSHLQLPEDEDGLLFHKSLAHLDENSFHESRSQLLIRDVHNFRENTDCPGETVVLLMNYVPAHMSERVLRLLGENQILAAFFMAEISILQASALVLLDAMKKVKTTLPHEFWEDSMSELTQQLAQVCKQTVASKTMLDSF